MKEEKYRRSAGIIAVPEEEMDLGGGDRRDVGAKIMAGGRGLRRIIVYPYTLAASSTSSVSDCTGTHSPHPHSLRQWPYTPK